MANNNQQHVANSNHQQPQNIINNKQQIQSLQQQQQPLQQQQQPTQHNHNGTAKKPPVIMAKSNGDIRHGGVHLIAPPKSQDSSCEVGKTTVLTAQLQQQQRQPLQQRQETRGPGQQQQQRNEPFGLISSSAAPPPVSSSKTIATSPVQSELSGGIGGGGWEHDFTGYPQRPPAKAKTKIIYDLGTPEMNSQGRRETKKR